MEIHPPPNRQQIQQSDDAKRYQLMGEAYRDQTNQLGKANQQLDTLQRWKKEVIKEFGQESINEFDFERDDDDERGE